MEPRFRVRLDEMLDDAEVPPGLLRGVREVGSVDGDQAAGRDGHSALHAGRMHDAFGSEDRCRGGGPRRGRRSGDEGARGHAPPRRPRAEAVRQQVGQGRAGEGVREGESVRDRVLGLVPLNLISTCRTNLREGNPEVSHEASDHVRNCRRCRSHYCNHHAVVVLTFDRASCRRYGHRSLQEFPQPGRDKSFRPIALLSGQNTLKRTHL